MKAIAWVILFVAVSARADVFTWDFTVSDGAFDFNAPTGQITTNGITMNFAAVVSGDPNAKLNAASGYFGVNATVTTDSTSKVDAGQAIMITFTSSIYTSIKLQVIDSGAWSPDAGYYQVDTGSQVALTGNNQNISPSVEVLNKTLTYAVTSGETSLNGITVEAIPEPATVSMVVLSGLFLAIIRRMARA